MMEMMKTLNEQGVTIIMITRYGCCQSLCQSCHLMNDGEILMEGSPEEVLAETEILRQASVTTTNSEAL